MARSKYSIKGRRKELLEETLNTDFPGAKIGDMQFSELENLDLSPELHFAFDAPSFARKSGNKMYFTPASAVKLTEWLAQKSERRYDLVIPGRRTIYSRQEYGIPKGYKVSSMPEKVLLDNDWARYKATCSVKGSNVICERELIIKVIEIKKQDYRKFREFCVNTDAEENKEVVLVKQ